MVRDLRIKKGMTQEELAFKTEVSARTIQRIENGEVDPRAYTLQMIAKALEVDYNIFVNDNSETDENDKLQLTASNWFALIHLSGIVPLFFPTFLIWYLKRDIINGISIHYRDSAGIQLRVWVAIIIGLIIYLKADQPIPLIGVLAVNAIFAIFNAVKAITQTPTR